ncbi:HD domain-containing protein [Alkalicella caledoniensis]|uniref:HD domain-containing protein n=1 Tax=Alkalicella caledoniensis TaxID=2731377 RepID=A0A7G9W8U8_ALKCA|nr:HD domain-containing protein [Alkalicella caledoniensis]QNO15110.1 HD domain-containing protein [Alkalicella caledoniensis]
MDIQQIEDIAFDLMKERKVLGREKGFIFYHGRRVGKIAQKIYDKIVQEPVQLEKNLLYVGGIFHDIGKGIEPHNETGAVLVKEILKKTCDEGELQTISDIIREHNLRGSKYEGISLFGKIIQDADIIDHMGSMDIWIAFMYHAQYEESAHNSIEFFSGGKWEEICGVLRSLLNFPVSIEAFDKRMKFTKKFIEQMQREVDGELF